MAVILAESAAVTKSRLLKGFNGDNININGRVISIENADKGFKAAGSVKPPYYAVMVSGNQKGFAAGAASAFNDYSAEIRQNKYNAQSIINRYFDDMIEVINNCGIENSKISIGIVCAFDDCVVAAKMGGCHLLRFSDGELFEIALEQDGEQRGFQFVDVVTNGDIYALIGEEASGDLDYESIVTEFDSGKDLKGMLKGFYNLLSTTIQGLDCSIILVKLSTDTERTFAAVPIVATPVDFDDVAEPIAEPEDADIDTSDFYAEPPVDGNELEESEYDNIDESEQPKIKNAPSAKRKFLNCIPIIILIIILAVASALYLSTRPSKTDEGETVSSGVTVIPVDENVTTGDLNGSNGMIAVGDNTDMDGQNILDITTSANQNNVQTQNTTRAPSSYTQSTTRAPATEAPTTEATTAASTTEAAEATTAAPTTEAVEATTAAPTTAAPVVEEPVVENVPAE